MRYEELEKIVMGALQQVGVEEFKRTSLFLSNRLVRGET